MTAEVVVTVENKDEEVNTTKGDKNMFQRVKERLSGRKKKAKANENSVTKDETAMDDVSLTKSEDNKVEEKNGTEPKTTAIEKVKDLLKQGSNKTETSDDKLEKDAKKVGTLQRVKERLSTRKKKSQDVEKDDSNNVNGKTDSEPVEEDTEENLKDVGEISDENNSTGKDKEKTESFLRRLLNLFRSRKKSKSPGAADEEDTKSEDKADSSELSDEDKEILAICGDDKVESEPSPTIPSITTTKPPLPVSRRVPASATTAHTRPMSQLDDALKQFKLSTAASRENLRNSRQDLNQMEEHVKVMIRSRPATPLLSLRASQDQGIKISSSLTNLSS